MGIIPNYSLTAFFASTKDAPGLACNIVKMMVPRHPLVKEITSKSFKLKAIRCSKLCGFDSWTAAHISEEVNGLSQVNILVTIR